jgi:hypothetical protein
MQMQSVQPGQIITDGLQLRLEPQLYSSYPGSGTTCYDLSSNMYVTSLQRGVTYSTARAPSFGFNGATNNRYIDVGQYISSNTFTLSSWFKSSNTSTFQMLFSKETATTGTPWNYRLYLNQTSGVLVGDVATGPGSSEGIGGSTNLCNNIWHNAVFVRDPTAGKLYLYVDGIAITNVNTSLGSIGNNQNVWIGLSAYTGGGVNPNGSYPVNGQIGQSLIYNVALSANQIKQNFNAMRGVYGV